MAPVAAGSLLLAPCTHQSRHEMPMLVANQKMGLLTIRGPPDRGDGVGSTNFEAWLESGSEGRPAHMNMFQWGAKDCSHTSMDSMAGYRTRGKKGWGQGVGMDPVAASCLLLAPCTHQFCEVLSPAAEWGLS